MSLKKGPTIVRSSEYLTLCNDKEMELQFRESRSHKFTVPHEVIGVKLIVTIVFKGVYDARGYITGRIGGERIPASSEGSSLQYLTFSHLIYIHVKTISVQLRSTDVCPL